MKLKQTSLLILPAFVLASAMASLLAPADPAAALTAAEKKACYEKWAGGYVGTAGDRKKLTSAQFTNFEKKSNCNAERGGTCKILRYTDGASIQCQRKDGKYDNGSGGWGGTTGGGSGNTGDDGKDSGTGGGSPADCGSCAIDNPVEGNDCGGVQTAIIKCDAGNSGPTEDNGIWALLLLILNILTVGVGIFAVAGIVYGSILYTTAEDKADQVKKATDIIRNVIIGLVLFALMYAGLNFLIPGGAFSDVGSPSKSRTANNNTVSLGDDGKDDNGGGNGGGGGGDQTAGSPSVDDIAVRNFRDAATSTGGNVLKPGILFRSPALGGIGPKDAKELGQLMDNNGLIIDLREASTVRSSPDKDIPGARNVNIPMHGILDTTPMVTEAAQRAQVGKALKAAANARGPVLIHCAAGKDRTGWTVAMIMFAAGATDAQVMKEYLKSNDEPIGGGVKAVWLKNGLQKMRSQYGGYKGYLKAAGLSDADIKKLAKKFGA